LNINKLPKWILSGAAGLFALSALSMTAYAQGGSQPRIRTRHRRVARLALLTPSALHPSGIYNQAAHVAAGAGLRNSGEATIRLRGMPSDAIVRQAWLYWDFTGLDFPGLAQTQVILTRLDSSGEMSMERPVNGSQIGTGADPCWIYSGDADVSHNFAFKADVSDMVNGNGDYIVSLLPGAASATDGSVPFSAGSPTTGPLAEGASLVVIYQSKIEPMGTVLVYDLGLAGDEFAASPSPGFSYAISQVPAPGNGPSIFTEIGADGQQATFPNGLQGYLSFKSTKLNSTVIAGPGATNAGTAFDPDHDSDWNGSDGGPLNQLWDTHSHDVTGLLKFGNNSISIYDSSDGGDCLVGIANVLTVR
jgi:hypothetical protein